MNLIKRSDVIFSIVSVYNLIKCCVVNLITQVSYESFLNETKVCNVIAIFKRYYTLYNYRHKDLNAMIGRCICSTFLKQCCMQYTSANIKWRITQCVAVTKYATFTYKDRI